MQCKVCGKEFTPSKSNVSKGCGFFCGMACYQKHRSEAMKTGEYKTKKTIHKFICKHCGKEFERTGHDKHNNTFCSLECSSAFRSGTNHFRYNKQPVPCIVCGKEMMRSPAYIKGNKWGNFCSTECKGKWMSINVVGKNNHNWQGGISYEPYCPLFNKSFKNRVRAFFDNKCVLCGVEETEETERLHVHHVEYNKKTCCDNSPKLFVALCRSCHTKTNHYREKYAEELKNLVNTKYQGRSYFTVEEWELLNSTPTN